MTGISVGTPNQLEIICRMEHRLICRTTFCLAIIKGPLPNTPSQEKQPFLELIFHGVTLRVTEQTPDSLLKKVLGGTESC